MMKQNITKKIAVGAGLGFAAVLATAGSAFAHDDAGTDPAAPVYDANGSHAYLNGGGNETTDEGYPGDEALAGDGYLVSPIDSTTLMATAHVLGYIEIREIKNVTADVNPSGAYGVAPDDDLLSGVQGFDFPTQTPIGEVSSDTLQLVVATNTDWDAYASVVGGPFTNDGAVAGPDNDDSTADEDSLEKAVESFSVQQVGESATPFVTADEYVKINTLGVMDGGNGMNPGETNGAGANGDNDNSAAENLKTLDFVFLSGPDAVEAGDYSGVFSVAVMANH